MVNELLPVPGPVSASATAGPSGLLLVDKPTGLTSHDVVDRARRLLDTRRVGHTGTLDPAATGLLVLCVGKAARLQSFLTSADKTYEGTLRFGVETDTYDRDGTAVGVPYEGPWPAREDVAASLARFVGEFQQSRGFDFNAEAITLPSEAKLAVQITEEEKKAIEAKAPTSADKK